MHEDRLEVFVKEGTEIEADIIDSDFGDRIDRIIFYSLREYPDCLPIEIEFGGHPWDHCIIRNKNLQLEIEDDVDLQPQFEDAEARLAHLIPSNLSFAAVLVFFRGRVEKIDPDACRHARRQLIVAAHPFGSVFALIRRFLVSVKEIVRITEWPDTDFYLIGRIKVEEEEIAKGIKRSGPVE